MSVPVKSEPDIACKPKPPHADFSANANQSEIYDEYLRQEKMKESRMVEEETQCTAEGDSSREKVAKMVEWFVVYQNSWEMTDDFLSFEDASDDFRGETGTLFPLWRFRYEEAKGLSVTALCWSTKYNDLFAVGLGSYGYDHEDHGGGMLLFYTKKMHTHPEIIFKMDSGVMCVDIHKQRSELVVVGMTDGCVAVYNLQEESKPIYKTTFMSPGKHSRRVMQVKWTNNDLDGNYNFLSMSVDGRVVSWTLREHGLDFIDIIKLPAMDEIPDYLKDVIPTSGLSLDIHKKYDWIHLVASKSGTIYKGDTYSSLKAYNAHFRMSVRCVRWNPFHSQVFISCDLNWMVKVWDERMKSPVFTFDLGAEVTDVAWAPYSSTVFAAVTTDGKVHVFDLNVNKYEALCQQIVSKRKSPVKIEFNPVEPIIIVGDDSGHIISFKLSPNLRKTSKDNKGQELSNQPEEEIAKMEQLLSSLR